MPNAIDRLFAIESIKQKIDEVEKKAKLDAEDYLASVESTSPVQISELFGPDAGEYKRGRTRAKKTVEYNLADKMAFAGWLDENPKSYAKYILEHAEDFGQWWLESTGEVPDGISRVEYEIPAGYTAPKIYKPNYEHVRQVLASGGSILEAANKLLLEGVEDGSALS